MAYADKQAWIDWVEAHDFDVFGTLNFLPNHKPSLHTAQKIWQRYFNRVDRLLYGRTAVERHGIRFERIVFTQCGAIGDNAHIHFAAKAPISVQDFCIALNALWAESCTFAAPPSLNVIQPIISKQRVSSYLLHDFWLTNTDTLNTNLTHINPPNITTQPKFDAQLRLKEACKGIWRLRARDAYAHQAVPKAQIAEQTQR